MRSTSPCSQALVNGVSAVSTRRLTYRQTNLSPVLRMRPPGRRPASMRIWNPLQMPITRPPPAAKSAMDCMMGLKRAMAPQRR